MSDFLSRFQSDELIGILAMVLTSICGVIAIIGAFWYHIRKLEVTGALKKDMLERGMSAYEIKTVLEAGMTPCRKTQGVDPQQPMQTRS
jgi:hypothetical protein